ncbi:MAG TPA: ester cyclase [Arthrobacter sp.]|nr:ester cyclase [Arthrobacter sp.]
MTTDQNKEVVRRFFRAFEDHDETAMTSVLSPELQAYVHGSTDRVDREQMLQGIRDWNTAFSNTRFTLEDQVAEGDLVACRVTMTAVHSGAEYQGIAPAGLPVKTESLTLERVVDGRIVERRVASNWAEVIAQITPATATAAAASLHDA